MMRFYVLLHFILYVYKKIYLSLLWSLLFLLLLLLSLSLSLSQSFESTWKPIVQATLLIINIIISRVNMYRHIHIHTHKRTHNQLTYTLRDDMCIWFSVTPLNSNYTLFLSHSYSSFSHIHIFIHIQRICSIYICSLKSLVTIHTHIPNL